jgi:pyruvate,orthophosphate dikinase
MVFGNLGDNSGTGVAFTRDAGTGEDLFNGEFLVNAQGEDVVAGTPHAATGHSRGFAPLGASWRWSAKRSAAASSRRSRN